MVNELSTKLAALEKKLGPEYSALIVGLEDIDPETENWSGYRVGIIGSRQACVRGKCRKSEGARCHASHRWIGKP